MKLWHFFPLLALFTASCNQTPRIRLVDLRGKPSSITTAIPEQNMALLAMQSNPNYSPIFEGGAASKYADSPAVANNLDARNRNKYASPSYQTGEPNPTPGQQINLAPSTQSTIPLTAGASMTAEKPVAKKSANLEKTKTKKLGKTSAVAHHGAGIFVQVGSFSVLSNAKRQLEKVQRITPNAKGKIEENTRAGKKSYRVLIGPHSNQATAKKVANQLNHHGIKSMVILKR